MGVRGEGEGEGGGDSAGKLGEDGRFALPHSPTLTPPSPSPRAARSRLPTLRGDRGDVARAQSRSCRPPVASARGRQRGGGVAGMVVWFRVRLGARVRFGSGSVRSRRRLAWLCGSWRRRHAARPAAARGSLADLRLELLLLREQSLGHPARYLLSQRRWYSTNELVTASETGFDGAAARGPPGWGG